MRRILVAATVCTLMVLPIGPSGAGGMTSFDFPDEYALVGESVTARATFFTEARGTGRIENGPWHAYLLPERTWIEPPHLPAGVVDFGPIAVEEQGDGRALASIAFIVPDVTTGPYTIGICNVPCTDSFLGDLGGGWLSIARTEEGAALLRRLDRTARQLHRERYRLAQRVRDLERPLEGLQSRLDGLEGSVELRLTELEDRLRAALAAEPGLGGLPWAPALLAAAVVAAAVLFARRRRRLRLDPIPQEPPVVEWEVPEEVSART
jgi:hypothetical protein